MYVWIKVNVSAIQKIWSHTQVTSDVKCALSEIKCFCVIIICNEGKLCRWNNNTAYGKQPGTKDWQCMCITIVFRQFFKKNMYGLELCYTSLLIGTK